MKKQHTILLGLTSLAFSVQSATFVNVSNVDISALLNPSATRIKSSEYSFTEQTRAQQQGKEWIRHQQRYRGIPIYGESVVSLKNQHGVAQPIAGRMVQDIDQDIDSMLPFINKEQAISLAQGTSKSNDKSVVSSADTNAEIADLMILMDDQNVAQLVYRVSYLTTEGMEPSRPITFVDAKDGRILDRWEGIAFKQAEGPGGNQKSGRYYFGNETKFGTFEVNDYCQMDSPNVVTLDMNSRQSGGRIHQFTCPVNVTRSANGAYAPMNDAQYFGQRVFDMYRDWLNSRPIRQKLTMRVHYGNNYGNAFWDGQQMTFGDGGWSMYPLATWDVIAHEVSHGYTEQNSNLEYRGMSGGMNESFSDVAAAALSYYIHGSFNWKMGEHVMKRTEAMRFFINPENDGSSIGHASAYYSGMDVHNSSGVFNKAFYHLATSQGWDIKKAFLVYATANKLFWQPRSTFVEGANGVCQAAEQLGYETQSVMNAFQQVGVTALDCDGSVPTPNPLPNPPTPSDETDLELHKSATVEGAYGDNLRFVLNNAPTQGYVTIETEGGLGDADMFIAIDRQPSESDYDCASTNLGTFESCLFLDFPANRYHVLIVGKSDFAGVSLTAYGNDNEQPPTPPLPQPEGNCAYVPEWTPYYNYYYGEIVQYNGYMFSALQASAGLDPFTYSSVWRYLEVCQ
ncbi:M4 family metallopeptidase [Moritella marina]|uniref:M4 family metallopeptidase n=1 Tax=Moritella marina TaxID=90736 RepID=UPI0037042B3B